MPPGATYQRSARCGVWDCGADNGSRRMRIRIRIPCPACTCNLVDVIHEILVWGLSLITLEPPVCPFSQCKTALYRLRQYHVMALVRATDKRVSLTVRCHAPQPCALPLSSRSGHWLCPGVLLWCCYSACVPCITEGVTLPSSMFTAHSYRTMFCFKHMMCLLSPYFVHLAPCAREELPAKPFSGRCSSGWAPL